MLEFEPLNPGNWRDPYPVYRALRDDAPLHRSPSGIYCLSRYEDVAWALKHEELFSSSGAFEVAMLEKARKNFGVKDAVELLRFLVRSRVNPFKARRHRPENLIICDPPRHDVLRNVVNRGFTPRRIQPLEKRMREIVAQCMGRLQRAEVFDVVRDLAIPLPVTVIAELLGVDPADRERFKGWSDAIIAGSSGSQRGVFGPFIRATGELNAYMQPIVKARRDAPAEDLLSVLAGSSEGEGEGEGEGLDDSAILSFIVLLLVAGNETTTNLIGNGTLALLDHPSELARVGADLSLVPGMVEEVIRFDSPVQFVLRRARRDIERHGETIPAEAICALLLGAANRDERRFEEPDRFDVTRESRGHLGFGFGVHFCLGASLARLEAKVAFEALAPELPHLARSGAPTAYIDSYLVRGPSAIELSLGA